MEKACVASGAVPLLAVTVPLNNPGCVGVPLMTPALDNMSPAGNWPLATMNATGVEPVAV